MSVNKKIPTCPEEEAYLKYINEHRNTVKISFLKHGQYICLCLSLIGIERKKNDFEQSIYDKLKTRIASHDKSKYDEKEFEGYRQWFFPKDGEEKNHDAFLKSWQHHYQTNDHHWQYWIDGTNVKEMDRLAIAEMILDWEAMSVQFKNNPVDWYNEHKNEIVLGKQTRELVEKTLNSLQSIKEYPYTINRKSNRRRHRKK